MSNFKYEFRYTRDDSDWVRGGDYDGASFTTASKESVYTDCTPWTTVLEDFLTFLGSNYGYDVRDQVEFNSVYSRAVKFEAEDEDDDTPSNS
jgi:hypothetical protein